MESNHQIIDLLQQIRDNQRLSLEKHEEQLAIARAQIERSKNQVEESIALQRQAMARFKKVSLIAFPGILFCIGMILYLVVRYF